MKTQTVFLELEKDKFKASIPFIERDNDFKILLAFVRGSQMYGTATETSDVDITFIYQQPLNEILKGNYVPYTDTSGTGDIVGYEIERFIELLTENSPAMLEALDIPEECIIYKHESMNFFQHQGNWISKLSEKSMLGYAFSQIKKATGLNKFMNHAEPKERKGILEFCHLIDAERTIPFLEWIEDYKAYNKGLEPQWLDHNNWGLVKTPVGKGIYALFLNEFDSDRFSGLVKDNVSTQLRVTSIPKEKRELRKHVFTFYYNQDGFEVHCKQHKAYWEWVEKRNKSRFDLNQKAGQGVDLKNMSHLFRLLELTLNISLGKGVIVKAGNKKFLQEIKDGKHDYKTLLEDAERLKNEIQGNFESLDIQETPCKESAKNLLLKFRLNVL